MKHKFFTLIAVMIFVMTAQVFALKIPTGDSVRALDVKEEGDALVEVIIGGTEPPEITTPIGKVKAKVGSTVTFYPSGALKEVTVINDDQVGTETPIGSLVLTGSCSFYESGSPMMLNIRDKSMVKIGEYEFWAYNSYYLRGDYDISFYDSGSKDILTVSSLFSVAYDNIESITYINKSGIFEFDLKNKWFKFFEDGSISYGTLSKSPDDPAFVKESEVYIRGEKPIEFYEDGSIKQFVSDEVCMTKQDGIKLNIPAGNIIELWQNGNIKNCITSNEVIIKTKAHANGKCWFFEDGSLFCLSEDAYYSECTDTFYEDGTRKRNIVIQDNIFIIVLCFYNTKGEKFYINNNSSDNYYLYNSSTYEYFYFQPEDKYIDIAMVYFNDNGNPSSYVLFKKDKDGNLIYGDFGVPVADTKKKTFLKK